MKNINKILVYGGMLALSLSPNADASALLKPTSGVTQALLAKTLDVQTRISGAFAQTTITTTYANPNNTRIEADFLYSAPKNSVVTGFSYWYGEEKVVARVVEKKRATKIYQYITSRMRDPALIEMIGKNLFRAKIFPIEANADLKIEIKLAQTIPATKDGSLWVYSLAEEMRGAPALQKIRLRANFAGLKTSSSSNIGALKNGALDWQTSNYRGRSDWRLRVRQTPMPLRATLYSSRDGGSDGFFALSLVSKGAVASPRPQISGVSTYDLFYSKKSLRAGEAFTIFGRYRGSGSATVAFGGQSASVVFQSGREAGNVAAQLWAADKIEALSRSEKNRVAVMSLSKRFGVPSKWTSWLAIPEEERRNFKRQMLMADQETAARAYAEAIGKGNRVEAAKKKLTITLLTEQLKKIGYSYADDALTNALNEELRATRGRLIEARLNEKLVQEAVLENTIKTLQAAGARDDADGVDMPAHIIQDELRIASRLLLEEVEANRENSNRAQKMRARLEELSPIAKKRGWGNHFLYQQAHARASDVALKIAQEGAAAKPNPAKQQQLRARLTRIVKAGSLDATPFLLEANRTVWQQRAGVLAAKLSNEIAGRRENGSRAKALQAQLDAIDKKAGGPLYNSAVPWAWWNRAKKSAHKLVFDDAKLSLTQKRDLNDELMFAAKTSGNSPDGFLQVAKAEKLRDPLNASADALVTEVLAGRENTPKAQALKNKVETLSKESTDWWQKQAVELAYVGRANQLAYQIESELAKKDADPNKISQWEKQLETVTRFTVQGYRAYRFNSYSTPSQFRNVQRTRVASKLGPLNLEEFRTRVVGLNPNNARQSYSSGDPLICIDAASDARSVIAILPDGTIKKLEYRPQTRRWEVNFDIPVGTSGGDYFVTLIIVEKSGARHSLKMRYRVDALAPQGKINLQTGGSEAEISIGAEDDVTRVTAFTPWGERIDLRRDANGAFSKKVKVPTDFAAASGVMRFVLIDGAHNRTEISVDWK